MYVLFYQMKAVISEETDSKNGWKSVLLGDQNQIIQWVWCQPIKNFVFQSIEPDKNPNPKYNGTSVKTCVTVVARFWNDHL